MAKFENGIHIGASLPDDDHTMLVVGAKRTVVSRSRLARQVGAGPMRICVRGGAAQPALDVFPDSAERRA